MKSSENSNNTINRSTESNVTGDVHFIDSAAKSLLAGSLAELYAPTSHGWREVKHNPSRTVYRGSVGDQELYLKHFHRRGLFRRLWSLAGMCDAKRELDISRHLNSAGVSAAPVLAASWRGGGQWVVTKSISPAQAGDEWHVDQLNRGDTGVRCIRRASLAMAELVAKMHAAGVVHRDLHCGNILVCEGSSDDAPSLVLMDLHRTSRRRRLSRRARAANLAQLCYDRSTLTSRTERLRFLKHYLRFSGAPGSLSGWEMLVSFFARRHARRQYSQRCRRILRTNRYFAKINLPGCWRGHVMKASKAKSLLVDSPVKLEDWSAALAEPAELLADGDLQVIKDSPSGRVVRRSIRLGGRLIDVFVKRSCRRRPLKMLTDCFRLSRALHAFKLGHMLLSRGFATVVPLAALQRRCGPFLLDSILVTEALEAPQLERVLIDDLAAGSCEAHRTLVRLGRMLRRLHDHGFAHRDLKAVNVLVSRQVQREELVLVDLDGLAGPGFVTIRRRLRDLSRLNVSLLQTPNVSSASRLRVLLAYLSRPGCGRVNFKMYWRVIEDMSASIMRRQRRSEKRRLKRRRRAES